MSKSFHNDTYARHAMTATTEPRAAAIGIEMIKKGGNAVDAAIAMAAMMTVVEPTSNGLGSDCFALVSTKDGLFGLNSSGPAPRLLSIAGLRERGHETMPTFGFDPVMVPGAVKGWASLHKRFGVLTFPEVMMPAIEAAKNGFVVSPIIAENWQKALSIYQTSLKDEMFSSWFTTFAPRGKAPLGGEIVILPDHAHALELIADSYGESLYHGELADSIEAFSMTYGGWIRKDDLKAYDSEWVTPLKINYRGTDVYELPPNGQGIVALSALGMLSELDVSHMSLDLRTHVQIEAIKLAFADAFEHVADPQFEHVMQDEMLDRIYLKNRSLQITNQANNYTSGLLEDHGTVYLATADPDGMMVSFIQSNYMGFGSGLVVPNTGIALNNRGMNFAMNPSSKNALIPGKRPYHTIIPGFLYRDGKPFGPFGIMGGFMQPQAHVQVIMHLIDDAMGPQEALDAWRFQWLKGQEVLIESGCPEDLLSLLGARGHHIRSTIDVSPFGRGQIICRGPSTSGYRGGTERRADGHIAIW